LSTLNIGNDPLCSYLYRASGHLKSSTIKEQTGNIHCVSANIQLPACVMGLWIVAREIQTNDIPIRIRFNFLVLDSWVAAPHENESPLIRWRVPNNFVKGNLCQGESFSLSVAQMSQSYSSMAKLTP